MDKILILKELIENNSHFRVEKNQLKLLIKNTI